MVFSIFKTRCIIIHVHVHVHVLIILRGRVLYDQIIFKFYLQYVGFLGIFFWGGGVLSKSL